jgi:CRISPR-associated exonuclease Cas4
MKSETEPFPLSLLNDYLFCPRRAALKEIEGQRAANVHTLIGDLAHEHADLPGYEVAKGVTLLRALPVWSERLGLSGKCDIVERHPDGVLVPVEYKKSKRRAFENDDVQLCAQALCLEEMFQASITQGAIFHAASKRRRDVAFTSDLRDRTEAAIRELQALFASGQVPPAVLKPACDGCSLKPVCMPEITSLPSRLATVESHLFQV